MRAFGLVCVMVILAWTAEAQAKRGLPSEARLAEMGLAGMEVLTDAEASTIRICGRPPNRWGDLYPFIYGVSRLQPETLQGPPLILRSW